MGKIDGLIDSLSSEAATTKRLPSPLVQLLRAGLVLVVYAIAASLFLGRRPDLAFQIERPFYLLELIILPIIAFSSLRAAFYLSYPDSYQQKRVGLWPLVSGLALIGLILLQILMPADSRMQLPEGVNGMDCATCICVFAMLPSAFLFVLLRKGATTHPLRAGLFIALSAASTGCFILRLAEPNDSLVHVLQFHYLTTLACAFVGTLIGKFALRW